MNKILIHIIEESLLYGVDYSVIAISVGISFKHPYLYWILTNSKDRQYETAENLYKILNDHGFEIHQRFLTNEAIFKLKLMLNDNRYILLDLKRPISEYENFTL